MQNKSYIQNNNIAPKIDVEILNRLRPIAAHEGCSVNTLIRRWLKERIEEFENSHLRIKGEEEDPLSMYVD